MSWDHEQYVDFVTRHSPAAVRAGLLRAASKPYGDKYPKIFLTYYSMPDWLDVFSFEKRLTTVSFTQMIGEYKHAAQKHQDNVAKNLDRIASYATGKALLNEVGSTRYWIRVMPYWHYFKTLPGMDYFNSTPRPLLPGEALSNISLGTRPNSEDSYERNAPIRDDNNNPIAGEKGTGKGANVVLFFSAETWEGKDAPKSPGYQADEVLFHELVHVSRMIRGRQTRAPVEGGGGYGNIEEYLATVVTNTYMSDKGLTSLRGLYSNELIRPTTREIKIKGDDAVMVVTDPLPKGWSVMKDPDKFYQNPDKLTISPRQLMQGFSDTQKDFYFALAHLPDTRPKFNPARLHFKENLRPNI
jgi:hypothetical protein